MTAFIAIAADVLVAVLLVATIASAVSLSRRIARLKADESAMRQTIGDLMLATETAERAIAGLRTTLTDCDRTLAERLRTAERYAADLADGVEAGETVLARIGQIVSSTRAVAAAVTPPAAAPVAAVPPTPPPVPEPRPAGASERLGAAAAAARALTERALSRLEGRAA
jgi:hypothetical protein